MSHRLYVVVISISSSDVNASVSTTVPTTACGSGSDVHASVTTTVITTAVVIVPCTRYDTWNSRSSNSRNSSSNNSRRKRTVIVCHTAKCT